MIVHLGVIMIAIALAASNSFTHTATLDLRAGEEAAWGGHTFELTEVTERFNDAGSERAVVAGVLLDREQVYEPRITTYLNMGMDVGTPSVRTGFNKDVYLTLEPGAAPGDTAATIRVFVKPMILWLWVGGLLMAVGTLFAAFPGSRRRRPTDAVSAPVPAGSGPAEQNAGDRRGHAGGHTDTPDGDELDLEPTEVPV